MVSLFVTQKLEQVLQHIFFSHFLFGGWKTTFFFGLEDGKLFFFHFFGWRVENYHLVIGYIIARPGNPLLSNRGGRQVFLFHIFALPIKT